MPRIQLSSIDLGKIQPLTYQGADVFTNHRQIVQLLGRRLGPRHAGLFAQPVVDQGHDIVDWFVQTDETVRPLAQATPEEAQAIRDELEKLTGDIRQYAEKLKSSGESHEITIGKMLELALSYPGDEQVFLVGDQPVLTAWGMTSAEQRQVGVISRSYSASVDDGPITPISRTGPGPTPRSEPSGEASTGPGMAAKTPWYRRPAWGGLPFWLWAALAALLLALLLLFGLGGLSPSGYSLPGCDSGRGGHSNNAPSGGSGDAATTARDALLGRIRDLQEELRRLQDEWLRRQAECLPTTPPELIYPPTTGPESVPKTAAEPVPAPAEEPTPNPVEPETAQPGDDLVVPKQSQEENDLGFLRGKWSTVTGLKEQHSGRPVVIEYEFDEHGNGRSTVIRDDGTRCHAPMRARFDANGDLVIEELTDIQCGGTRFFRSKVKCKVGKDGKASCQGYQSESDNTYEAVIKRKGN